MAYNLPHAWDPGFVLPKNVKDEGLQRRALITKMMPRGTYDQPQVGTGGYVVPQYVMDEGYGQGTFTTKWMPSGSYVGPKIPNWLNQRPKVVKEQRLPGGGKVVTVQPLSDDEPLPPLFEDYGAKAAQMLIARVSALPAGQRQQALRAILDKIDTSLWTRTQAIWNRYRAQGVAPAQAFPMALARAMSAGIAAEIITTGIRRSAPQAQSLLGLGCYGCAAALGATAPVATPTLHLATITGITGFPKPATPAPGALHLAPSAGAALAQAFGPPDTRKLQVGPFLFPYNVTRTWDSTATPGTAYASILAAPDIQINSETQIPDEWIPWLNQQLTQVTDANGDTDTMHNGWGGTSAAMEWPEWDAGPWFNRMGIVAGQPMRFHKMWALRTGYQPFAWLTHPGTGEKLAMHVTLAPLDRKKAGDPATNPIVMKVWLSKVPPPDLLSRIWSTLAQLIATVVDTVVEAVKDLGDLACDLLSSPTVGGAAGAAGAAAGGPPGAVAGQVGAAIAKNACGTPAPPPMPVLVPQSSILPVAILAGGGVLALLLLISKKKAAP